MADPSLAGLVNVLSASRSGVTGGLTNPTTPVSIQQIAAALGGWANQPGVPARQHGLPAAFMAPHGTAGYNQTPTPYWTPGATTSRETRLPGSTNPVVPPPFIGGGGETRIPNPESTITLPPPTRIPNPENPEAPWTPRQEQPSTPEWVGGTVVVPKETGIPIAQGTPNFTQYAPFRNPTKNFESYPVQKPGETLYEYALRTAPQTGFGLGSIGSLGMRTSKWFEGGNNPDFRQVIDSVINPWAYMSEAERANELALENRDRETGLSSGWEEAINRPPTSWQPGGYSQSGNVLNSPPPPELPSAAPGTELPRQGPREPVAPAPAESPYIPPETVNPTIPTPQPEPVIAAPEPAATPSGKTFSEALQWAEANGALDPIAAAAALYQIPFEGWGNIINQFRYGSTPPQEGG